MAEQLATGYRLIDDLRGEPGALEVHELRALDEVWREQRQRLEDLDELRQFRERLIRSWAIETGVIERVYSIDRGVTELLLERGLEESLLTGGTDKPPAKVIAVLRDHADVVDGLFDYVAQRRPLTVGYIKEVHAALTRNQATTTAVDSLNRLVEVPLLRGEWKQTPNNPRRGDGTIHQYCPPELVGGELDRLIEMHLAHVDTGVAPEVEAAFLHHRFTQIHPFQDGNGRVARALATLVYIRAGWFPLSIHRDRKADYIDALESADAGDLAPLVRLFGSQARDALVRALSVGDQAEQDLRGIRAVIGAARDRMLGGEASATPEDFARALTTADRLVALAERQLQDVKAEVDREIASVRPNFSCQVEYATAADPERLNWYRSLQLWAAREELHYFANIATYSAWCRVRFFDIDAGSRTEVVVCLNAMGKAFRGLVAGVTFYVRAEKEEAGERMVQAARQIVSPDLFQLNYREEVATAERRFADWLVEAVTVGLATWERDLENGL